MECEMADTEISFPTAEEIAAALTQQETELEAQHKEQ
jgi:hypothetical protein